MEEKGTLLQRLKLSLQLTRFSWLKLILFVVCMHVLCSIARFKFVSERIALSQIEITFAVSVTCSCVTTPGNVHEDVHVLKNMANLSALGCRIIELFIVRASESGQLTAIVKTGHEEI